jgi:hypothetical protein
LIATNGIAVRLEPSSSAKFLVALSKARPVLFAAAVQVVWFLLRFVPWLGSGTSLSNHGMADAFIALQGSVPGLPSSTFGWVWHGAVCVVPLLVGLGIALSARVYRRLIASIVTVLVLGPVLGSLLGGVTPSLSAFAICGFVLVSVWVGALIFSPIEAGAPRWAVFGFGVLVSVVLAVGVLAFPNDRLQGSESSEGAAMSMIRAAQSGDALYGLKLLAPSERAGAKQLGEVLSKQTAILRQLQKLFGDSGPATTFTVSEVTTETDATIVHLVPKVSGPGSAVLAFLGGIPVATQSNDGRWFVNVEATVKAIVPGI